RAAVEPDLGLWSLILRERPFDRLLALAMRTVWVREVARHVDDVGPKLVEQLADDAHVRRTHRVLPDLARLVERQVQEAAGIARDPERLDRAHRLRLADLSLDVLDLRD